MKSKNRLRASAALGALAVLAMVVPEAAMAGPTTQALLKRLHEKGILSDEDYTQMLAEEKAEAAAPAPAATASVAAPASSAAYVKPTSSGIGLDLGVATIKFTGSVNGYYVHDNPATPSANTAVTGGIASVGANANRGNSSSVRNGLLPGFLTVSVSTKQAGWDVGAFFGMYPGINSTAWGALGANNGGQPTALATAGIDFRQTYLTFGKPDVGTFKIGRDIGLFGSDAILNDITLLSSGPTGGNVAPGNTTLGRIGSGYIYTDFQPQMTYSSPSFGGAQVSVGVFQPLSSLTGPTQANSTPGFQAKLSHDGKFGGVSTHLWLSGISQKHDSLTAKSYTGEGVDMGARVTTGPLTLTGYYYTAKGLGTTVFGLFDTDAAGNARKSDGFYLQALASFGKFSVGGSYGESNLKYANAADALANPALVSKNSSYVGQARYRLTNWVTLIGEYVHAKAQAHNGNAAQSDALAVGGILFF
jgi:hypothetical protein